MAWHIGPSGWSYDHWQGLVYPPRTPVRDRLDHYLARYSTGELNASYYLCWHFARPSSMPG